jgi:hypothetical protein
MLLAIGQGVLGTVHLRWVDADLHYPDWIISVGADSFDTVLSTTVLHWFLSETWSFSIASSVPSFGSGECFSMATTCPSTLECLAFEDLRRPRASGGAVAGPLSWWREGRKFDQESTL